jgi:hypothetical protein
MRTILVTIIVFIVAVLLMMASSGRMAKSQSVMETPIIPALCFDKDFFHETIGKKQSLFFVGLMPETNHVLEIYRGETLKWTIVMRVPMSNIYCVIASGSQLIDIDWFTESSLLLKN